MIKINPGIIYQIEFKDIYCNYITIYKNKIYKMKFFFIMILSMISLGMSLTQNNHNLCMNCKFYLISGSSDKYSKCSLFPTIKYKEDYFLGNIIKKKGLVRDYRYCDIARKYDTMCGKNGKKYEENSLINVIVKLNNIKIEIIET